MYIDSNKIRKGIENELPKEVDLSSLKIDIGNGKINITADYSSDSGLSDTAKRAAKDIRNAISNGEELNVIIKSIKDLQIPAGEKAFLRGIANAPFKVNIPNDKLYQMFDRIEQGFDKIEKESKIPIKLDGVRSLSVEDLLSLEEKLNENEAFDKFAELAKKAFKVLYKVKGIVENELKDINGQTL